MTNIACIFPGQGIRINYVQDIFQDDYARKYIDKINKVIGYDITVADQNDTVNSQLSIILISHLLYTKFSNENNVKITCVAGHSLGQYSAVIAARVLSFNDVIDIIYHRATYMSQDVRKHPGYMIACIGNNIREKVEDMLSNHDDICVANYNSPKQIIVSGVFDTHSFINDAKAYDIKCIPLKVAGAFHSKFMSDSNDKMNNIIKNTHFSHPTCGFILNKTGKITDCASDIKNDLIDQIKNTVNFVETVQTIKTLDIDRIVEINTSPLLAKFFDCHVDIVSN